MLLFPGPCAQVGAHAPDSSRCHLSAGLAVGVSLLWAAGCGGSSSTAGGPTGGALPLGEPIAGLTVGAWTWVPFPDSACGDGSPTGIGVNPGTGLDLVFFLDGGGACSSGLTCSGLALLGVTTLGPFGAQELTARTASQSGSVFDRSLPGGPFPDATYVFVPYCTGDVHGGDRTAVYTDGPGRTVHHMGHANVLAYLKRVAATWPRPGRLVVTGASAGGFGTLANYPAIRSYFPDAQGFLVDDSGPPLSGNPGSLIQDGLGSWGIADVLDPLCGVGVCEADLSKGMPALAAKYPGDRLALLSWASDPTMTGFYLTSPSDFTARLGQLVSTLGGTASARAFVASGSSHTMLGSPAAVSQGGTSLLQWLGWQLTGSPLWVTVQP